MKWKLNPLHSHFTKAIAVGLGVSFSSFAIQAATVPSASVSGLTTKQTKNNLPPNSTTTIATKVNAQQIQTAAVTPATFKLLSVDVTGSSVYSAAQLAAIYQPYLNRTVNNEDVLAIANAISNKYDDDGYALVRIAIPRQHIKNGVLKIQISESYIDEVTISGEPGKVSTLLNDYAEQIKKEKPLRKSILSHYAALIQQISGLQTQLLLESTGSGAVHAAISANLQRFEPYAVLNNYESRYYGGAQLYVGTYINSLLRAGDTTNLVVGTSPGSDRFQYAHWSHDNLIGTEGNYLALSGTLLETRPGLALDGSKSSFNSLSALFYHPLALYNDRNWYVRGGIASLNDNTTTEQQQKLDYTLRSFQLGLTYEGEDNYNGTNTMNIDMFKGINALGAKQNVDSSLPEDVGDLDYTYFLLYLSRLQELKGPWSTLLAASAQYSFDRLPPDEQFTYGGIPFGRVYDPGEIAGDSGINGNISLRLDTSPRLADIQYFIYYDAGVVWNRNAADTGILYQQSGTSAGIGARMIFNRYLSANLELDQPLSRAIFSEESNGNNGRATQVLFQVSLKN